MCIRDSLNTDPKLDELIYEELDDTFGVSVYKTKSKKYLVIASYSTLTSEYQILNANTPNGDFQVFQPRTRGLEYGISHFEDSFYVVSNADGAQNFKLSKTSELQTEKKYWKDVIPHREAVLLEDVEIFKDFLEKNNWIPQTFGKDAGPSLNFIHPEFKGKFGLIAPYSKDFCQTCNRLRITSRGDLRLCLFGNTGISIRHLLQDDTQKDELVDLIIKQLHLKKESHYLELGDTGITPNLSSTGG